MRVRAAEAERAAAPHERRVHRGQPLLDRPRRAADERRVERRRLLEHVLDLLLRQDVRLRLHDGARARAVNRVVEQESFAHRLAGAERREPHRPRVLALLDRDGAGHDERHEAPRLALLEQQRVALVVDGLDEAGELVDGGVGEAVEESKGAEGVAVGRTSHRRGKVALKGRAAKRPLWGARSAPHGALGASRLCSWGGPHSGPYGNGHTEPFSFAISERSEAPHERAPHERSAP